MKKYILMVLTSYVVGYGVTARANEPATAPLGTPQAYIRCEVGQSPEALQRAYDIRLRDSKRDVSKLILKTIDLTLEPEFILFDEAPSQLQLIKSFVKAEITLKIYSALNTVTVQATKGNVFISRAIYGNFNGAAESGGFTGFVGINDSDDQMAYTCYRLP